MEDTDAQKGNTLLPGTHGLVILAAVVLAYFGFMRRKKTIMIKPDTQLDMAPLKKQRERSMDQAELIDTENIISTESITLPLDRKSVSIGRDSEQ